LSKELPLLTDYQGTRGHLVETLAGLDDARVALDSLGQEPTPALERLNPNNRPIPGLFLPNGSPISQRDRMFNFEQRLKNDRAAMDAINRLAGMTLSGGRAGGPRVVDRSVTVWLCYQMQWRSAIAEGRVRIEKALRPIAAPEGKVRRAMAEAHRLVLLAAQIADQTDLVFPCTDLIRPPKHLLLGLAEAPEYFARIDQGRLWVPVIGAVSEGTPETLSKDSVFGAFAVVMHALASHAFEEQELSEMIADLARASIGVDIGDDYRAVVHRRDVFLELRGHKVIRRQERRKRPLA
jgi:hypothetical protein